MIDLLDTLLHRLLRNRIAQLTADTQVRFQPPDEDWRGLVPTITDGAGNPANSLNVYLVDLRENRRLRSNERERRQIGPDVYDVPPPRRVDCHYLISAWSPVAVSVAIDPTQDEHALLAEAARVLGAHDELDPVAIYAASSPPQLPPPALAEERFPLMLLPPEGFPKYAEFWGTMGDKNRWKPCVYIVVTVALREAPVRAGPPVTTIYTHALPTDFPAAVETRFHIGGTVHPAAGSTDPVPMAHVELLTAAGLRLNAVRADALGRFVFADVPAGNYQLRARLTLLPTPATPPPPATAVSPLNPITVPSPGGGYDIHF
jgi:hypothetical protein